MPNARGKDWELYEQGILSLDDVPADYPLNANHRMQLDSYRSGQTHVDDEALSSFLSTVRYPLYYFDVETTQSAVPLWDRSLPYQQLPPPRGLPPRRIAGGAGGPLPGLRRGLLLAPASSRP